MLLDDGYHKKATGKVVQQRRLLLLPVLPCHPEDLSCIISHTLAGPQGRVRHESGTVRDSDVHIRPIDWNESSLIQPPPPAVA